MTTSKEKRVKVLEGLPKEQRDAVIEVILATMNDWEYRQNHDHRLSPSQQTMLHVYVEKLNRICDALNDMESHPLAPARAARRRYSRPALQRPHGLRERLQQHRAGTPLPMRTEMFVRHELVYAVASKLLSLPWQGADE